MKAILLNEAGGTDNLIYTELPAPIIGDNEVLVQVKTISINPVDVKSRANEATLNWLFGERRPLILGWDISGIITETGKNVSQFKKGDEVFGMVNFPGHGKAYAEYVAAPESHLALRPANITHEQAAASTLVALTAWQALVTNAKIKAGDRILIHGASGGVGHFAVQIAKHLGAYVVGTSSAKNKDFVLGLGADEHIDYNEYDWSSRQHEFDFVLDTVGGDNIDLSIGITKKGGTMISIPSGLNETVSEKAKAKGVDGYFILVQSDGKDQKAIAQLLESSVITPHLSAVYPFEEMAKAHRQIESGRTVGKVVVNTNS